MSFHIQWFTISVVAMPKFPLTPAASFIHSFTSQTGRIFDSMKSHYHAIHKLGLCVDSHLLNGNKQTEFLPNLCIQMDEHGVCATLSLSIGPHRPFLRKVKLAANTLAQESKWH